MGGDAGRLPLHEPVPATGSRRPWATAVRMRLDHSTRNAATASRRHGLMLPMRGVRAVVATLKPQRDCAECQSQHFPQRCGWSATQPRSVASFAFIRVIRGQEVFFMR